MYFIFNNLTNNWKLFYIYLYSPFLVDNENIQNSKTDKIYKITPEYMSICKYEYES